MKATEVTAGPAEINGSLLPCLWRDSLHVTCGLTACTPGDQLRAQCSVTSMGKLYFLHASLNYSSHVTSTAHTVSVKVAERIGFRLGLELDPCTAMIACLWFISCPSNPSRPITVTLLTPTLMLTVARAYVYFIRDLTWQMTSTFAKMTKFASVIHSSCQSSKFNIKLNYNKASEKITAKQKLEI